MDKKNIYEIMAGMGVDVSADEVSGLFAKERPTLGCTFEDYCKKHDDARYKLIFNMTVDEVAATKGLSRADYLKQGFEESAMKAFDTALSNHQWLGVHTKECRGFVEAARRGFVNGYDKNRESGLAVIDGLLGKAQACSAACDFISAFESKGAGKTQAVRNTRFSGDVAKAMAGEFDSRSQDYCQELG